MPGWSCVSTLRQFQDPTQHCTQVVNLQAWPKTLFHRSILRDKDSRECSGGSWSEWAGVIGWEAKRETRLGWLRQKVSRGGKRVCPLCQALSSERGGDDQGQDHLLHYRLCRRGSTCACKMPRTGDDFLLVTLVQFYLRFPTRKPVDGRITRLEHGMEWHGQVYGRGVFLIS